MWACVLYEQARVLADSNLVGFLLGTTWMVSRQSGAHGSHPLVVWQR